LISDIISNISDNKKPPQNQISKPNVKNLSSTPNLNLIIENDEKDKKVKLSMTKMTSDSEFSTSSSNKLETLASTLNSKRKASVKFLDENSIQQKALFFFIPCINCNNLIHLDEIERHSNLCTKVKEDVIKAESSNYSFHVIDYKLKKLKENLSRIQNSNDSEYEKDRHLYEIINKYIGDVLALSTIHLNTLNLIKKIVSNLNVLISTFKGCLSTLIIIERARVIILEKLNILKEDLKKLHENKKDNKERKSGLINMSKFKELEMKKKREF